MYYTGLVGIIFQIISIVLQLLSFILLVYVVISWLYAFDIIDRRNQFIRSVWEFCSRVTDPVLRPLRRLIPPIAGVDLSVMVLLLLIYFTQGSILPWLYGVLTGRGPIL